MKNFCFLLLLVITLDPSMEPKARAIADQLRCPVCRGIPIAESPAELAQNMMQQIRAQLVQGKSEEEILNYFEERYGEWILLKPKPKGMNLTLWLLPAALLAAGVIFLFFAVRRWSSK